MEVQKMELKNLAPARQELQPLKIGDSINEMKACLRMQMLKVGIRAANMPDAEEKNILLNFVKTHYGNYSPAQITEAFYLAITGQLPIKDSGCYENFSCEYFGRIMAGYRAHLINTGRLVKNTDKERQHGQEHNALALQPAPANWEPHIAELRAKVQSGEIPEIIPTAIYDWLERKGLLKLEWQSFLSDARRSVHVKLREEKNDGQRDGRNINSILADIEALAKNESHHKIVIEAKKMAIIEYLKQGTVTG